MSSLSGDFSGVVPAGKVQRALMDWSGQTGGRTSGEQASGEPRSGSLYTKGAETSEGSRTGQSLSSTAKNTLVSHKGQTAFAKLSSDQVQFSQEMRTQLQQIRKHAIEMRNFRDGLESKFMGFLNMEPSPEQVRQAARFAAAGIWDMLKKAKIDEDDHEVTSRLLALLMKIHSNYTFHHAQRVTQWALSLAEELGIKDQRQLDDIEKSAFFQNIGMTGFAAAGEGEYFKGLIGDFLSESSEAIKDCSSLHDIGKMKIPQEIINKPDRLTEEEYSIIKTHPLVGVEIVKPYPALHRAIPGIKYHHEKWDGSGYPDGLNEEAIPLTARIISIVDTFDAMTEDRPYRRALLPADALNEIIRLSGIQFDPAIVPLFVNMLVNKGLVDVEDLDLAYGINHERLNTFNNNVIEESGE